MEQATALTSEILPAFHENSEENQQFLRARGRIQRAYGARRSIRQVLSGLR